MITCTKRYNEIPFAHRQPLHKGHCRLIHGHNWSIEVTFGADWRDENGFVVDFGKCKRLGAYVNTFDHALVLCEGDDIGIGPDLAHILRVKDASSEGLAQHFFEIFDDLIKVSFPERGAHVVRVKVYEDSRNSATYEK